MAQDLGGPSSAQLQMAANPSNFSSSNALGGSDPESAFANIGGQPALDLSQVSIGGFEAEEGGMDSMLNFGNAFSWIKRKGKMVAPFGLGHNLFAVQNLGFGSLNLSEAVSFKSNLNAKISTVFSKSQDQGR